LSYRPTQATPAFGGRANDAQARRANTATLRGPATSGTVNDMPPAKPVAVGYVRGEVRQAVLWHLRRRCPISAAAGTHHRHTGATLTALATTLANRGHQPCLRCAILPVLTDAGEHLAGSGLHYIMCSYGHGEASKCERCAALARYAELSHTMISVRCQGRVMLLASGVLADDARWALHALYLDADSLAGLPLPPVDVWEVATNLLAGGANFATAMAAAIALHTNPAPTRGSLTGEPVTNTGT